MTPERVNGDTSKVKVSISLSEYEPAPALSEDFSSFADNEVPVSPDPAFIYTTDDDGGVGEITVTRPRTLSSNRKFLPVILAIASMTSLSSTS